MLNLKSFIWLTSIYFFMACSKNPIPRGKGNFYLESYTINGKEIADSLNQNFGVSYIKRFTGKKLVFYFWGEEAEPPYPQGLTILKMGDLKYHITYRKKLLHKEVETIQIAHESFVNCNFPPYNDTSQVVDLIWKAVKQDKETLTLSNNYNGLNYTFKLIRF